MPINRTYQGKVLDAHWVSGKKFDREYGLSDGNLTKTLTEHLSIYHTAINYYLVCFAALAKGSKVEALMNLHQRVKEAWNEHTYRRGGEAEGFKELLQAHLPHVVTDGMSFEEACDTLIQRRNNAGDEKTLQLALESLLNDLGGESSIQQGGRSYLPYFCNPKSNANFPRSSLVLARTAAKAILPEELHNVTDAEAKDLRDRYSLHHFVNLNPAQPDKQGEQVIEILLACNSHLVAEKIISKAQASENESAINQLDTKELILPSYMGASAKGAEKDRLYAFLLLKWLPFSQARFQSLKSTYPKPKEEESEKKVSAKKQAELDYETHLQSLGEDPILLARGERKYVFQSFSSRFTKQPTHESPEWIELDISAFKEALKTLNQIEQKTTERLNDLAEIEAKISYYREKKGSARNPDEPVTFAKDKRLSNDLELWNELKAEATSDEHEEYGDNAIRWRSIKGWRDLLPKLRKYIAANAKATQDDIIQDVWVPYQAAKKNVGNTRLFHTLANPKYHPLWLEVEETKLKLWVKNEWSHDLLTDLVIYDELCAQKKELEENLHIKLTPAHIVHSRRPIMLSDFTGSSKVVYLNRENDRDSFVTTVYAKKGDSTEYAQHRIELCFSSPRQKRDHISGSENRTLMQPLVQGLGLTPPDLKDIAPKAKELAVSIMPDFGRSSQSTRFLLNFPAQLNTEWIVNQLGREARWKGQFVGTKEDHLYLQWPATIKKGNTGWWENPDIIENGFTVFSVDLGLKSAAAYTTLKVVSCSKEIPENKQRYTRMIGDDGTRQWFAYPVARGTLRLPGEDAKLLRPAKTGTSDKTLKKRTEFGGSTGRKATKEETHEFQQQIKSLGGCVADWLTEEANETPPKHLASQNDSLLKAVKQAQGYLSSRHHILNLSKQDDLHEKSKEDPNERQKERLTEAIAIRDQKTHAAEEEKILNLQNQLKQLMILIANRILPQKDYNWTIVQGTEETLTGTDGDKFTPYTLRREKRPDGERTSATKARMIRYQRGLSTSRIEQLEDLRRRMSSLQRELNRKPGAKMMIGFGRFSGNIKEAAPEILEKLDHLKEQRVKQTAHLILTQALALRLKQDKTPKQQRDDYLHGEYEKIPNAQVADFIVIEDLNRYLTTQGRSKAENRQLMQWSHRAIAETLKELSEPFGLHVATAGAGYSSRFCASTSRPGFRATTITDKNLDHYILEVFRKKDEGSPEKNLANQIDTAFAENTNKHLQLLIPTDGGTMFVPVLREGEDRKNFPVVQADINAAHNVGLRAIAAPDRLDILHKLRVITASKPRRDNIREKAAYTAKQAITPKYGEFSKEIRGKKYTNFFHLGIIPLPVGFDQAILTESKHALEIASSLSLWSFVKNSKFTQCSIINQSRLE